MYYVCDRASKQILNKTLMDLSQILKNITILHVVKDSQQALNKILLDVFHIQFNIVERINKTGMVFQQ